MKAATNAEAAGSDVHTRTSNGNIQKAATESYSGSHNIKKQKLVTALMVASFCFLSRFLHLNKHLRSNIEVYMLNSILQGGYLFN